MPRKKTIAKPGLIKTGMLSRAEKAFIADKMHSMNSEQIGKKLGRSGRQVQREIDAVQGLAPTARMSLQQELMMRPEWCRFQKQFSDDELEEFKHQYVQIISQLNVHGEITATEELQVFQVITLKIQIDRTLETQKQAMEDMALAGQEIQDITKNQDMTNMQVVADYERWVGVYDSAKKTNKECVEQYKVYSDKQDKMLHALKSTRDQRIKVWENSDKSILGLVRSLVSEDQRELMGNEAEMMKVASQKEKKRLAQIHKYDDGQEDRPILTPETVLYEDEEEVEAQSSG